MRGSSSLTRVTRCRRPLRRPATEMMSRRAIQISASPSTQSPMIDGDAVNNPIDPSLDPAGKFRKISCNPKT